MRLNEIRDTPGATSAKKRLGRGIGSGLGKTAGKGTKGQKARAGVAIKGFEGGQMPLHRRLPKRGFNNIFAKKYNELNLGKIQGAIDAGALDGNKPITVEALKEAGLIRRAKDGVRLLGPGEIKGKLAFEVTGASQSAVKAVEAKGGTVTFKSITGREKPAADKIKADKRAAKRAALLAKAEGKRGKKAKGEQAEDAEAPKAAKAKSEPGEKTKADEGEAKKAKPKPAKTEKSE
jgi:large subunit ribosomal protein L15